MNGIVSVPFRMPCYMADVAERLRPASFMDIAQELAAIGAERIGYSCHDLKKMDLAWILVRMTVRFEKPVRRGDNVTLQTWHRGFDHVSFNREYRILDGNGDVIVNSTSSWVIMNTRTRRVERGDALTDILAPEPQSTESTLGRDCEKLTFPLDIDACPAGTHTVRYSDLDYNGHANNAKYTLWVMDCLPEDVVLNRGLKEISLNFLHEARLGDDIALEYVRQGDQFLVRGITDRPIFIARLLF